MRVFRRQPQFGKPPPPAPRHAFRAARASGTSKRIDSFYGQNAKMTLKFTIRPFAALFAPNRRFVARFPRRVFAIPGDALLRIRYAMAAIRRPDERRRPEKVDFQPIANKDIRQSSDHDDRLAFRRLALPLYLHDTIPVFLRRPLRFVRLPGDMPSVGRPTDPLEWG